MSQKVNAVPDPSFSVPPLTTVAGSRVSRRRVKIPSNNITAIYSPSNISSGSSSIIFDIADNESFLDMDKSMMSFDFTPYFMGTRADGNQTRFYPLHSLGFDGSSQSLMATVRIGNSQGLIIEELQAYATFAHIMDSYTQNDSQRENSFYDLDSNQPMIANRGNVRGAPESSKILHSHVKRRMYLKFKHSSFFKSCRMVPLFLMRNGIRIQVDLQDSYKLFTRKLKPIWQGPAFAHKIPNSVTGLSESDIGAGSTGAASVLARSVMRSMDWYLVRNNATMQLVVKKESRLAQILNLRSLSGVADYYFDRVTLTGASTSAVLKTSAEVSVPLKFVYTDEFGVDKIWYQGVFSIESGIHFLPTAVPVTGPTQHSPIQAVSSIQALQVASETITTVATGINTAFNPYPVGQEEVYLLNVIPDIDGFPNMFMAPGTAPFADPTNFVPFIPYAKFQPRIYADVNDLGSYVAAGTVYTFNNYSDIDYTTASNVTSVAMNSENTFGGQLRYANRAIYDSAVNWDFALQNVEMLCDFVKPSSEVFLQFQQAFQAPAGIPYAFKRILYKTAVLQPTEGFAQIPLPVSVRSLRGVLVVLSDTFANASGTDNTRKHFPAISSLMKRGLSRAQLVIGGQNYPSYDLNLTELGMEQIPELECLFNVSGLGGFNPSFDPTELLSTTNYAVGLGKNGTTNPFNSQWVDINQVTAGTNMGVQEYHDASKFVLGLSTMKKDGDFVTGVDTSQSGSVYLNLQFKLNKDIANGYQGDFGGRSGRQIYLQCFAICDAVFTLQNDANLVRY